MQGYKTQTIRPGDSVEYGCATSPYRGKVATVLSIDGHKAFIVFDGGATLKVSLRQLVWIPDAQALRRAKVRMRRKHLAAMRAQPSVEEQKAARRRRTNRRNDRCLKGYT